jgi:hypothetical protein
MLDEGKGQSTGELELLPEVTICDHRGSRAGIELKHEILGKARRVALEHLIERVRRHARWQ